MKGLPVTLAGLVLAALIVLPAQARAQTEQVEYYALDAIGSVRAVFDASGNVLARLDYEPFGRELSSNGKAPDRKFAGLFPRRRSRSRLRRGAVLPDANRPIQRA
jgi:hypothetical protein